MRGLRLGVAAAALTMSGAAMAAAPSCSMPTGIRLPGHSVEISRVERVPAAAPGTARPNTHSAPLAAGLPAYCRITGVIDAHTGADGKHYGDVFAVALPEDWNGRFLFQGGGGLNGTLNPPLGTQATGDRPALARGYAVVSTDGGHQGAVFDASFMADQRAALDFVQDSVGKVTLVAKQIVAAHYGRPAEHSYFVGCSTGGREAMLSAERYPDYFDGIVVGSPAMRTGYSTIADRHAAITFNQAAPRDAAGLPIVAQIFSAADRKTVLDGLLAQCDALDGLKDGVIDNVKACHFQPAKLACKGGKADGCLSAAQVKALEDAFKPPRDAGGTALYSPFPYDTGIVADGTHGIPGLIPSGAASPLGPPNRALTQDVPAEAEAVRANAVEQLTDTYNWTNLSAFLGHGGKILFYHGMSDPWFSPLDTLDYFTRASAANGAERWANASRFYVVPGMGHCEGGANTFDRFDLLSAVSDWVEKGQAPAGIVASRQSPTPAKRPLCPYPAYPRYRGSGDVTSAESFACAMPD